ncbi:ATP-binding protein [Jiangella gansuensis]|uniref:ATP-binding protein n=1 Tax=Jiangella gansuensis TaxID=281473 RepID=UPI0004AD3038|nr:ATP-binding protein [Jiangella gansuensis]
MGRVVATRREARSDSARVVELTGEVSNVPHARHLVAEDLRTSNVPPSVVENVLIVVTELVTNAVLHAQPLTLSGTRNGVLLQWSVFGDDVLIEVTDGGGADRPQIRQPTWTEDQGRGLSIVDAIAREWRVRAEPGRVTVHAIVGPWKSA